MDMSQLIVVLSSVLAGQEFLQALLDFTFKTSIIILTSWGIVGVLRNRLSNEMQHLLWMNALLCLALLPLATGLMAIANSSAWAGTLFAQVTVVPAILAPTASVEARSLDLFLLAYAAVSVVLVVRLLVAGLRLIGISKGSESITDSHLLLQAQAWRDKLKIKRGVQLKFSQHIESPISFGLWRPQVILPVASQNWEKSTLDKVLIHELSHIARLDWPTMLFSQIMCCLLWINPLVWLARKRVIMAAEESCDNAVLHMGEDGVAYAEDLLRLVQTCQHRQHAPLLAQAMFERSMLGSRVKNILAENRLGRYNKSLAILGSGLLVLALGACGNLALFGTPLADQEYLPLVAAIPQYPTRAAQRSIEGWVLVGFTVTPQGTVDESSLQVLDAEPAEIFDRTSQNAAAKFTFEPRIVRGRPVAVPGVQYLFRFELDDEPGFGPDSTLRPPPPARDRRRS